MFISMRSAGRAVVRTVGTGALTGALLLGVVPAAQAAAPADQATGVVLADAVSPMTAPTGLVGMQSQLGTPDILPTGWGHHGPFHRGPFHHHHRFFHHWWNPWRWFWFW